MTSTFGTYSVAYSGMYVSQAGLTTTTNNLANISTDGASRVRVSTADTSTTQNDGSTLTSGASVASITRVRDTLLDATYRTQNADASYWAVKSGNLEFMQELLSEYEADDGTSTDGLQEMIDDFFSSWSALSLDQTNTTTLKEVVEYAQSLVDGLTELDQQLQSLQADAVNGVTDGVDSLNSLAEQVAELTEQITVAEVNGSEASYLRDQRDALIDQMSSLANISVIETSTTFQVTINGSTLVNGSTARSLVVSGSGTTSDPLTITWTDTGKGAGISSGSIAAYLEDADQTGYAAIDTTSLPYDYSASADSSISNMRQALNDMLTTIAAEINSLQTANGGVALFTTIDATQGLSITNIQVNPAVESDETLIVAGTKSGDNSVAEAIYNLNDDDIFTFDGLAMDVGTFYESFISWIGTTGDNAASTYETQAALVTQVDNQRDSVSSISMDDELSNMIVYQEAYTASARVLSTIDGLIAGLIEDLG
jgi:flagellar hook-associated protein 1 FlgK